MFLSQALVELQGRPDLFAWRPTGEIIQVTNLLKIKTLHSGRPNPWTPKISDLMSNDWHVGDARKARQELSRAQEQGAA